MKHVPEWAVFEQHCNHLLGLDATPASGARWHSPGDGVDNRHYSESDYLLMVDAKYTEAGSFAVNREKMREYLRRAAEHGKRFALPLRFRNRHGVFDDWVVIPLDDYAELITVYRQAKDAQQ